MTKFSPNRSAIVIASVAFAAVGMVDASQAQAISSSFAPNVDIDCAAPYGTVERVVCAKRESEDADRRLNGAFRELVSILPEAEVTRLRDLQRKWIAFRDSQCSFTFDTTSVAEVNEAACFASETGRQADVLEGHLRAVR